MCTQLPVNSLQWVNDSGVSIGVAQWHDVWLYSWTISNTLIYYYIIVESMVKISNYKMSREIF